MFYTSVPALMTVFGTYPSANRPSLRPLIVKVHQLYNNVRQQFQHNGWFLAWRPSLQAGADYEG